MLAAQVEAPPLVTHAHDRPVPRRVISFERLVNRIASTQGDAAAQRWLDATLGWQSGIDQEALANAIASGDVNVIDAALQSDAYQERLRKEMEPVLRGAMAKAGEGSTELLRSHGLSATFNVSHPNVVQFARKQTANLIVGVPQSIKRRVRTVIARGAERGLTVAQQARAIRQVVPLTQGGAEALLNFRDELERLRDPERQDAALRAIYKRRLSGADQEVIKARMLAGTVTPKFMRQMTAVYSTRLLNRRALNIARTETLRAAHAGLQESWEQAALAGVLPANVRRFWVVTPDSRLSEKHARIPGMNPNGRGLKEAFFTTEGLHMYPPSRPNCRCSVGLVLPEPRLRSGITGEPFVEQDPGGFAPDALRKLRERIAAIDARKLAVAAAAALLRRQLETAATGALRAALRRLRDQRRGLNRVRERLQRNVNAMESAVRPSQAAAIVGLRGVRSRDDVTDLPALIEMGDSTLPADTDEWEYFYHAVRYDSELASIEAGGVLPGPSGRIFLSKDEIRDRGAGFVIVELPRGLAREGVDVVERGLTFREWTLTDPILPHQVRRVVREVKYIDGDGHGIREDLLADFAFLNPDHTDFTGLPPEYVKWFGLRGAPPPRAFAPPEPFSLERPLLPPPPTTRLLAGEAAEDSLDRTHTGIKYLDAEEEALGAYQEEGSMIINDVLRKSDDFSFPLDPVFKPETTSLISNPQMEEFARKVWIPHIDSAMSRAPALADDIVVWRAGDLPTMRLGAVFPDKGFVSTTTSREVADAFRAKGQPLLRIRVPAGTSGVWLPKAVGEAMSSEPEFEFLLPRGMRFRVTGQSSELDTKIAVIDLVMEPFLPPTTPLVAPLPPPLFSPPSPFSLERSAVPFSADPWSAAHYPDAPKPVAVGAGQRKEVIRAYRIRGQAVGDAAHPEIQLYHVTQDDPETLASIEQHGLIPAAQAPPGQPWVGDHSNYAVYLHQDLGVALRDAEQGFGRVVVVTIPADTRTLRRFIPDEDASLDINDGIKTLLEGGPVAFIGGVPSSAVWLLAPPRPVPFSLGDMTPEDVLATKVGPQLGSNPGGTYLGTDGVERYVKFYDTPTQATGEALANRIYGELGIEAPNGSFVFAHEGNWVHAAPLIQNSGTLGDIGVSVADARQVLRGFAADVLTANWDAVGLDLDNIIKTSIGVARVDQGGVFLHRAMGARKPVTLLDEITEWDRFLEDNEAYRSVFAAAQVTREEFLETVGPQIDAIVALQARVGGWRSFVGRMPGVSNEDRNAIINMLEARTEKLQLKRTSSRPFEPPRPPPVEPHRYAPVAGAPEAGEWDRSGPEPVWRQDHDVLARDGIFSWKGSPSSMRIHIMDEIEGGAQPSSGSGKQMRAQAAALLWELNNRSIRTPVALYRGGSAEQKGVFLQPWSESRRVAKRFAGEEGVVRELPPGAWGLRLNDYVPGSSFADEKEWILLRDGLAPLSPPRPFKPPVPPLHPSTLTVEDVEDLFLSDHRAAAAFRRTFDDIDADDVDGVAFLGEYQETSFEVNAFLRHGEAPSEDLPVFVGGLDRAIAQMPGVVDDVLVWRAGDLPLGLNVGDRFTDLGFMSTTTDLDVAFDFLGIAIDDASFGDIDQPTLLRIAVPKGTRGAWMPGLGDDVLSFQNEFVLPRGTQFRVVRARKLSGDQFDAEFNTDFRAEIRVVDLIIDDTPPRVLSPPRRVVDRSLDDVPSGKQVQWDLDSLWEDNPVALTLSEARILERYQGPEGVFVNSWLREGRVQDAPLGETMARDLDSLLARAPVLEREAVILRGGVIPEGLQVGDEFVDHGFVSATTERAVAVGFADVMIDADLHPTLMRIGVAPGQRGLWMDGFDLESDFGRDELEYLLPRGTRFKVVRGPYIEEDLTEQFGQTVTGIDLVVVGGDSLPVGLTGMRADRVLDQAHDDLPRVGKGFHSQADTEALEFYQFDFESHAVNDILHTGHVGKRFPPGDGHEVPEVVRTDAQLEDYINSRIIPGLDSAARRSPALVDDIVVWRAGELPSGLSVGDSFIDKGFLSTSTSLDRARSFRLGGRQLIGINVPQGSRAIWMPKSVPGGLSEERELLLPRGMRFRVVGKHPDPDNISRDIVELVMEPESRVLAPPPGAADPKGDAFTLTERLHAMNVIDDAFAKADPGVVIDGDAFPLSMLMETRGGLPMLTDDMIAQINATAPTRIPLDRVVRSADSQEYVSRNVIFSKLRNEVPNELIDDSGFLADFPVMMLREDGTYTILEGHNRVAAHIFAEREHISARVWRPRDAPEPPPAPAPLTPVDFEDLDDGLLGEGHASSLDAAWESDDFFPTSDQVDAAIEYADDGFVTVNRYLRLGESGLEGDEFVGVAKSLTASLDELAHRGAGVPVDMPLWRTGNVPDGLVPGDEFVDHGFVSTSTSPGRASLFLMPLDDPIAGQQRVLLRIGAQKGQRGIWMPSVTGDDVEREFLLARGLRYRVVDRRYDPATDITHVDLVVVPHAPTKAVPPPGASPTVTRIAEIDARIAELDRRLRGHFPIASTRNRDSLLAERNRLLGDLDKMLDDTGGASLRPVNLDGPDFLKGEPAKVALEKTTDAVSGFSVIEAEIDALDSYTGEGFKAINNYLRKGETPSDLTLTQVAHLDALMRKSIPTPEGMIVWRGGRVPRGLGIVGDEWTDEGFASASVDMDTALTFMLQKGGRRIVRIGVPEGQKGLWVPGIMGIDEEGEFLFPRGTRFRIVGAHHVRVSGDELFAEEDQVFDVIDAVVESDDVVLATPFLDLQADIAMFGRALKRNQDEIRTLKATIDRLGRKARSDPLFGVERVGGGVDPDMLELGNAKSRLRFAVRERRSMLAARRQLRKQVRDLEAKLPPRVPTVEEMFLSGEIPLFVTIPPDEWSAFYVRSVEGLPERPLFPVGGGPSDRMFVPEEMIAETVGEFTRMIHDRWSGSAFGLNFKDAGPIQRAFYQIDAIGLPGIFKASSIIHELGHHLEHQHPALRRAALAFLDRRAQAANTTTEPLNKITGSDRYMENEVANPDEFFDAYVGKVMANTADGTEVISMGLEAMYVDPEGFHRADPDHFWFILQIMRGMVPQQ